MVSGTRGPKKRMTIATQHAPHGPQWVPPCPRMGVPESWVCPLCCEEFAALFSYLSHARRVHGEQKGLTPCPLNRRPFNWSYPLTPGESAVMRETTRAALLRAAAVIDALTEVDVFETQAILLAQGCTVKQVAQIDRAMLGANYLRACALGNPDSAAALPALRAAIVGQRESTKPTTL